MFITSKLSAIPELVRSDQISAANGLINMVSMSAMIIGMVAGNWLYAQTKPAGQNHWWIYASALLGVAGCGLVSSLLVGRLKVANPARPIPWNPAEQTVRDLGTLFSMRPLFLVALGSTYFWMIGALSQREHRPIRHQPPRRGPTIRRPVAGRVDPRHRRRRPVGRSRLARQGRTGIGAAGRVGHRADVDA